MFTMDLKSVLDINEEYRDKLYARGFFFTDDQVNKEEYPFYGIWKTEKIRNYTLMVSPKQTAYVRDDGRNAIILVGHAYDPVDHCNSEDDILKSLLDYTAGVKGNRDKFWDKLNQLTGIFTIMILRDDKVYLIGDPTCMQTTFYTRKSGKIYVSSHTALLGELLHLEFDEYVKKLIGYRFFSLLGNSLPGDLSPYKEVKRLVPNHYVSLSGKGGSYTKRFYFPHRVQLGLEQIEDQATELLHNNMELIADKWQKPAISMTGGCDSKTTLACANGCYENFKYFSYQSSESEKVDAEAASKIAGALGLEHKIYTIPDDDSSFENIELIRTILEHNSGDILPHNRNDVRKRAFFADTEDFDVEVKSWASEIGRSYYSKRFHGRTRFGKKPTPRKCTTMYKFFLHNRKLVRATDEIFADYLKKYFRQDKENPVEWQEQFFWEFRVPSWNGLVITGEHRYSFDITIPYNNRILLNLLLGAPIEDRISDRAYSEIREKMNPVIDETGVSVQNLKHTQMRERFENLYYIFNNLMP